MIESNAYITAQTATGAGDWLEVGKAGIDGFRLKGSSSADFTVLVQGKGADGNATTVKTHVFSGDDEFTQMLGYDFPYAEARLNVSAYTAGQLDAEYHCREVNT